ncbi:MAG: hypothetical protein K2I03_02450, partial [Lachnospiraceae bacterium]|nr:hypothetical protein [Lachnospiraceae bacterium]
ESCLVCSEMCIIDRKRVSLAMECINLVRDTWNNRESINLEILLKSVNDYLEDKISAEELMKINNDYRQVVEEIAYNGEEVYGVVGLACCYVANIALYDELIIYNTDDEDLDEELDSFTWDTSYLISLIYSADENIVESNKKRTEYWKWYLDEIEKIL